MKAKIYPAKDTNITLDINEKQVYSKYSPIESSLSYIEKTIDYMANSYLLVGLGLGYHLHHLDVVSQHKPIQVLCVFKEELDLLKYCHYNFENQDNIRIVTDFKKLDLTSIDQVIIPNVWLQLMTENHPLYEFLEDIKIKQDSFDKFKQIMFQNFQQNCLRNNDFNLLDVKESIDSKKIACLVSSGPSLNQTVNWLKQKENIYILCVGSALKVLESNGIIPDAVIVSDPQIYIRDQLNSIKFPYQLYYLSTAYSEVIEEYLGDRTILLQLGYRPAEELARNINYPNIDVGGSVATVGFSLLEFLDFEKIVLFGQDLAFTDTNTHASGSTSGRTLQQNEQLREVVSNSGQKVLNSKNLFSYLKWFNQKCLSTKVKVYNTAVNGAKIKNVKLIQFQQFLEL